MFPVPCPRTRPYTSLPNTSSLQRMNGKQNTSSPTSYSWPLLVSIRSSLTVLHALQRLNEEQKAFYEPDYDPSKRRSASRGF